jgi:hypothetical protein
MQSTIRVFDIVGGPLCVSAEDGQLVHDKIVSLLKENQPVVLSFESVEMLIPYFLNIAIGQLYGEFPEDSIRSLISFCDMDDEKQAVLNRVINNAKSYLKSPKQFDQAWKDEVGDEE